jgi:DNA-binding response OmpR family regulator
MVPVTARRPARCGNAQTSNCPARHGFKAPIIMLTGHNTDSDTILGLESGANDSVTKPFRFAVLLARIRAQLRQHEASEDAVFTIGPYTFRPSSKILLNPEGNEVRLTEKETGVLRYLCRAGQRPVSPIGIQKGPL